MRNFARMLFDLARSAGALLYPFREIGEENRPANIIADLRRRAYERIMRIVQD